VVQRAPIIYQEIDGARRTISGRYVLEGKTQVGFQVAAYDRTKPLVIDPVLVYSTYLGGTGGESAHGIAVDGTGNAYVTGSTRSSDFPVVNPLQPALRGSVDVFVSKLNSTGSVVYSTYLGGSDTGTASADDVGLGIAVDTAGNAYVTGATNSADFPTTANALQPTWGAGCCQSDDAFVVKLNPTGSALVYATYLGGTFSDFGNSIAVDSVGNAHVTGFTNSLDFPTANPIQATLGGGFGDADAFVAKLNAAGTALIYSTYLGGSGAENATGIAVDAAGNAYVAGNTSSADFPTVNPVQGGFGGNADAFVAKLDPIGTALVYSTYLGGSGFDGATGIAVDSAGSAYVTGGTGSPDFPTVNPVQGTRVGNSDGFVAKLNAPGTALVYATYLGIGSFTENFGANAIAVDSAGNAYVTGQTDSPSIPLVYPMQGTLAGGADIYVVKLNAAGSARLYSTYLGGSGTENAAASRWMRPATPMWREIPTPLTFPR